jgi:CheY-like chemotaxis protein
MENYEHCGGSEGTGDSRGRVLVVEDDPDLRCYLTLSLEMAGYQTIESNNGLEALQAIESCQPDLAVVDLNMPVMSGFRFLRLLKNGEHEDRPRMPVIVISGDDPQEAMDVVVEVRPDAYLKKPFEAEQLLERVDHLLETQD